MGAHAYGFFHLPVVPVKTSPWDGLSEIIAVASTVDARSNVRVPEVVICPEGLTVTNKEIVETFSEVEHSYSVSPLFTSTLQKLFHYLVTDC